MSNYSKYRVNLSDKAKKSRTITDQHTGKTITFDSAVEKRYYDQYVVPMFIKGQIIDYDLQRNYELLPSFDRKNGEHIRKMDYVSDFWLKFKDGHVQVKDVKGSGYLVDPVAKIKRKLMYYYYPNLDFQWICYSRGSWVSWDQFMKEKRAAKRAAKEGKG